METMPYRDGLSPSLNVELRQAVALGVGMRAHISPVVTTDWRAGLPTLHGDGVTLRELRPSDASSLFAMLTTEEVSRFLSPPPTTVSGFERFIDWTLRQRATGEYVCFAIVPTGCDAAVGLIQFRASSGGFSIAEWGFALGSAYWGSGIFARGAELALEFAFTTVGVHRLEARAAVPNGRGNSALQKLGAVQEAVLRQSLRCRGNQLDQTLWTILADEWRPRHAHAEHRKYWIH